ncbi:MAG: hypothetical protein ACR2Q3_01975, partial [Woeseiaceae bacterium]
ILSIFMYAMATPNPATPTSIGEYVLAPIYLAIAGSISYFVFRYARRLDLPGDDQQCSAVITEYYQVDDDSVQQSQIEDDFIEHGMSFDRKKIAGLFIIGIAVLAMRYGFIVESILFVIVGVSMVLDVRLWRR